MNSPKVAAALGLALILSVLLTACGGGGSSSTPPPPAGPPTITTATLTNGVVNTAYLNSNGSAVSLFATGGTGSYTWSITSGNLPPGLSLAASTGIISGTPTLVHAGGYPFTAKVTDAASMTSTANLNIYIEGVVSITPSCGTNQSTVCPSGSVGVIYTNPPAGTGTPVQLTASGGLAPYTWSLASGSLPPGLSLDPATCTNSSGTCVISGTPTANTSPPAAFSIQVTDSETLPGKPAVGDSNFTITIMSITTTSLPTGFANVPYNGGTVTVAGGSPTYSWTASNLPPGLSLDPATCMQTKSLNCAIKGTPNQTGNYSPMFQVTDGEKPPAMATAQISISIAPAVTNANLNGNYVFNFTGYNSGKLTFMAGSFIADGNGNITSGVLDYNDGNGEPIDNEGRPIPQTIAAGTGSVYSITANGLGTMTITTNMNVFNFAISVRSDGSGGSLIQSDPGNPQAYGSGMMMIHTPLVQGEQWPLCGNHVALGLFGFDSSLTARYAAAGEFQYDPNTCVDVDNGVMDIDDGGVPSSATFKGAFNQYDNSTSRGIVGFTFNGDQNHRYFNPFYLISSSDRKKNEVVLLTENVCDTKLNCTPTNPTLWSALPQANPPAGWNNANLAGGSAVLELNALDTTPAADVTAGFFVGSGSSNNNCQNNNYDAATFSYDENQGGKCNGGTCGQPQSSQGTYCVDKITARVTLTGFLPAFGGSPPIFYLVKSNQGFVVGTDSAVTSGYFEQQTGSSFTDSSLLGLYEGGTITPTTANVTNGVSWLYADGNGNVNGMEDTSGSNGPGTMNFAYTYKVDNTGRALVCASGACNAQSTKIIGIAYVVSSTKFVLLPALNPDGSPDQFPALSIFGQ